MANIKKLTGFFHTTKSEGEYLAYTTSEIDENGNVTAQNQKGELVIVDADILAAVNTISDFLQERIDSEA